MRRYGQDCALARALDLIGDRWTLLIIRELLLGERHYKELSHALSGMGTNLLATRLQDLTAQNIVSKDPGRKAAYRLTLQGQALQPVLYELIRWEYFTQQDTPQPKDKTDLRWRLFTLQALVRNQPPKRLSGSVNFTLDDWRFHLRFRQGQVTINHDHDGESRDHVQTSHQAFRQLCQEPTPPLDKVTLTGSKTKIHAVLKLFYMT